jgi:N-acetylglucosamine kinase-like BadF-type ATPase
MLHDAVLGVDLGKTSCRLRLIAAEGVLVEIAGPGAPGLADDSGDELALAAVLALTDTVDGDVLARVGAVGIGAAGAEAHPDAARSLAKRISEQFHAPTAVINDALLAHLGAFGGAPGTILITGTGAIAFGLDQSGRPRQVDGWGPLLGDDGGGKWIGQEGLKAALRELDGRSGPTSLTKAAERLAGDLRALPVWVSRTGQDARQLASFAPVVIRHAEDGDPVARSIIEASAVHLVDTARAASIPGEPVCVVGGLATDPYFHRVLLAALTREGIAVVEPIGDPLDGAVRIATDSTLPHETRTFRV